MWYDWQNMRVKLQRASATDLPAYNPILPPSAITQVMLIAYPAMVSVCQVLYFLKIKTETYFFAIAQNVVSDFKRCFYWLQL